MSVIGEKLIKSIVAEVHAAKYFNLSVDSPPDVSHCDQLTAIIRDQEGTY